MNGAKNYRNLIGLEDFALRALVTGNLLFCERVPKSSLEEGKESFISQIALYNLLLTVVIPKILRPGSPGIYRYLVDTYVE